MFNHDKFSLLEWIITFFLLPIPLVNFAFIVFLFFKIGFVKTLIKIIILTAIYVLMVFIGLMFISF